MGAKGKPASGWSPQSSAALERAHQASGGMLRAFGLGNAVLGENEPFKKFLAGVALLMLLGAPISLLSRQRQLS